MKGFLKRDIALLRGSLNFYLCFVACMGILAVFTDMSIGFLFLYIAIFAISSITGLFSYDDFNHWTAYAAAVPNGRRDMVKARYAMQLLVAAGVVVIQLLLGALAGEKGALETAALYEGMLLIYAAVTIPINYYFGGTKARIAMLVIVGALAALMAMAGTFVSISSGFGRVSLPPGLLFLPAVGLGALAVSYRVSLGIMAKKEL